MSKIFVIGAGFSRTVGIAADLGMLDALNPRLPRPVSVTGNAVTAIESIRDQNFRGVKEVSFELFMSTVSALKYSAEYLELDRNIFEEDENEVRAALREYLVDCVARVDWAGTGATILDFVRQVNWSEDYVITFNYDLLIEAAAKHLGVEVQDRIIHLHGAIGEPELAWPTYTKFAYDTIKTPMAPRWNKAFKALRQHQSLTQLIFIGYSMPAADLEARGLFNYTDWYNSGSVGTLESDGHRTRRNTNAYQYDILVINPAAIEANYLLFRKTPEFLKMTLAQWIESIKSK